MLSAFNFQQMVSAFIVLFAVIDIIGAIPIIINLKEKGKDVNALKATLISFALLLGFFYAGDWMLQLFHVDIESFAIAGAVVIFLMALEMILDIEIFKNQGPIKEATLVPLVFPLLAGAGAFTTLLTLRAEYASINIIIALTLAITFASLADRYELIDASRYKDSLSTSIQDNHRDSDGMVVISGAAIIDWVYNTEASGFVYITSKDCGSYCDSYGKNLANYLKNESDINIYRFNATSVNDKDYPTAVATKLTLDSDNAPMLIYLKDGVIYDRVDNVDQASMESFLAKYK